MRTKPTLRKSGRLMVTLRPKIHIGLDEIADAFVYVREWFGDPLPTSRAKAIRCTINMIVARGDEFNASAALEEGAEADALIAECEAHAAKLFPELKGHHTV